MKKFTLETETLSRKADIKIKTRIYFLSFKRNIKALFSFPFIAFAIPTLIFGIAVFGFFQNTGIQGETQNSVLAHKNIKMAQLVDSTLSSKYKNIAKNRARFRKAERYKTFAMVRSAKVRQR